MRGRKPVPLEQRVRRGDLPPAVLTHLAELAELRPDWDRPGPPDSLGEPGRQVWAAAWQASWLTPTYDYDTSRVYMHLQEAQRLYALGDQVNAVQVRVQSVLELDRMRRAVQEKLGEGYWATDLLHQNRSFFSALRLEKLIAFLVIGLIILVAALNIVSTLILMVMEKVRDIGTLVSMGATSRSVMSLFMLQGTIIGIAGTTLGCALGIGISWAMDRYQLVPLDPDVYFISHVPFTLRPLEFVLTALVSLGISFLATLYPAWRASRLDPVEALQHE